MTGAGAAAMPGSIVVKGFDRLSQALGRPTWVEVNSRGKTITRGVQIWPIGVCYLKSELYSWLRLPMPRWAGAVLLPLPGL